MKSLLFFCFLVTSYLLGSCQTILYININSHNEETDFEGIGGTSSGQENPNYGYNNDVFTYKTYREYVKQIADTIVNKNAKWNFQSDWTFLQGCLDFDNGSMTQNTGGLNIIKWLQDSTYNTIELDPHFHASTHNIADVAWLYKLNGVEPSLNVGGFIYDSVNGSMQGCDWRTLKNGVQTEYYAYSTTQYTYIPEVLWGAAAGNHVNDIRNFGAWRPKYMDFSDPIDSFYMDDSTQLVFIGNGCSGGNDPSAHIIDAVSHNAITIYDELKEMAENINNGGFDSGKFYSASIQMKQSLYSQAYVNELSVLIDSINAYIVNHPGKMQWALLSEKKQIWNTVFNKEINQLSCGSIPTGIREDFAEDNYAIQIFPNPSDGNFSIEYNNVNESNLQVEVFDMFSHKICTQEINAENNHLAIGNQKNGMYIVKIHKENNLVGIKQLVILR